MYSKLKTAVCWCVAISSCAIFASTASAQDSLRPAATLTAAAAVSLNPQANYVMGNPVEREVPVRRTISAEAYAALKARANSLYAPGSTKDMVSRFVSPNAPTIHTTNFKAHTSSDGLRPPDTHGAMGKRGFVEVTNSHVDMWGQFAGGATSKSVTLATFFNYSTQTLFDPRCVYDSTWNRFVITAEAFAESNTVQYFFIAVSQTNDPTGGFWIYQFDVDFFNNNDFFDFPQLGMDQDSVLITANIFPAAGGYAGADFFAIAKARLYNGGGFSVPVFTGLAGTLAPPIVLDQNASTFLIAASPSGTSLTKYAVTSTSRAFGTLVAAAVAVPVTSYSAPPDAHQPGTSNLLDSGDSRFVNASTQSGNDLWQTHTVAIGAFPVPKFYRINTSTNTVAQTGSFFASGNSDDFNASITANANGDCFVTYTSTNVNTGTNAQVRGSGKLSAETGITAGPLAFTSLHFYDASGDTTERWGDYSAVTLDPADNNSAWYVNETSNDTGALWGSRIVKIGFP
jgi:hypothetical protein